MLNICKNHSGKWRYEFQPPKCIVVVFNESPLDYRISNRVWFMGDARLTEDMQYKHLGILLNKYLYIDNNINEAADKLKGTLLSLVNSGVHEGGLNPITSKRLYKSVVIPKALYGCELWNSLLPKHIEILEKAHRFCVRFMQSLPRRASTDVAFSLLNLDCIEYEIDYRKLVFFGQLCNLPPQYCIKEFFILFHTSESAINIMKITSLNQEYLFWKVGREYPKYFPLIQRADRMLGLMFSGRWIRFCHLCNEVIYNPTEHLLLFCRKTNALRENLWLRLILKFGLNFFSQFISETPKGQLELLFSGRYSR